MIKKGLWTIISLLSSSMLLLTSCYKLDESNLSSSDSFQLTCVQYAWTGTRAVTDDEGKGNFSEGDIIELFVAGEKKENTVLLEYTNNLWTPSLQRHDYGYGNIALSGIFPTLPKSDNLLREINIPEDQSSKTNYSSADILFASTTLTPSDISATLQFSHAMHRININIDGSIPDDLTVEVKSITNGQISLENGTVTSNTSSYAWMKPYQKDRNNYSIIILPQNTGSYKNGDGLIRLTCKGKTSFYKFNANTDKFNAGMQTTINLVLKTEDGGDVDMEFANQTLWVYGINSPNFPGKESIETKHSWEKYFEDGLWFRYDYSNFYPPKYEENQYLTWKEDFGWYDCNKSFEYKGDGEMCWAAGASNLIHWWMKLNWKYIEAYDKKFGPEYEKIKRPEKYTKMTEQNQQHSEVFNFFKHSFSNKSGWDTGSVNWFINGDSKYIYPEIKDFHGFFSKVFHKTDKIAVEIKNPSKENFNIWMKEAFKNNKAIGFSSFDFAGKGSGVHAMTIWGAEFDAEGNVAYIYFCDNNHSKDEPNHASLRRFKVIYEKSTIPEIKGLMANLRPLDYNDGTIPKSFPFSSLTLVDLRRDIWQTAFPEIE
ncbi:MAG: IdeS/Mac family cysteine endopeptidase [Parabacteroides sp.]|nr:IdeS/Mac family cysteine endopeptidase [Parabacteroides sp.]